MFALICGATYAQVTDILNQDATNITGTTYTDFTYQGTSGTLYAGNVAGNNKSIQLRSDKSSSGIVTKASIGTVKKVSVTWEGNTAKGRQLDIYGSNEPYTDATELYGDSQKGELIGSIVNGTSTEVEISGEYKYIGLRSKKNAMYLTDITIEWEKDASLTDIPVISPESGYFIGTQHVTITSNTPNAKIYYTTDGSTPTDKSTLYTSAGIDITETTTIKAIAYADGLEPSSVSEATYTKTEVLEGLSALKAKIVEDNITFSGNAKTYAVSLSNAVVTGVGGSNAYIEEGTTGILYYNYNMDLKAGQALSGIAIIKGYIYSKAVQLTSIEDATVTENATIPVTTVTIKDLQDNFDLYAARRVKISGATVTVAFESRNATIEKDDATIGLYDQANLSLTATEGATVDVTGYPSMYNNNVQLNVLSQSDIAEGTSGITSVTTDETNENAPVYNLSGQRVSKATKGILIQNGKKFINK